MIKLFLLSILLIFSIETSNINCILNKKHLINDVFNARRWTKIINAFIHVESNGNILAVNNQAAGVLQITPIYIKEINRIYNTNYSLKDRFSKVKSIEMFNLMNEKYNKSKNLMIAIKLHNPNAKKWYYLKIIKYICK